MSKQTDLRIHLYRFLSGYGMLLVLLLLGAYYSWVTWAEQHPTGTSAGRQVAADLAKRTPRPTRVLIIAGSNPEDLAFARAAQAELVRAGTAVEDLINGGPLEARRAAE